MCCRGGADTWLIHSNHGQMRKQHTIWATTVSTTSSDCFWIRLWIWNDSFHPFQQRARPGPSHFIHTFKGQTLDPGLKDFFCSDYITTDWCYLLKLLFGGSSCTAISHKHFSGPKNMTSLIQDVRFKLYPRGAIASEKQGDSKCGCVNVCMCLCVWVSVCMSVQYNKRLIDTYSLHWFPVAA